MSHHGSVPPGMSPEDAAALKLAQDKMHEQMAKIFGEFPDGKLNANDEGALAVMIGEEKGKVVLRFPKPIAWIGFTPDQALDIASSLIDHARRCGSVVPLVLRVGSEK